MIRNITLSLLVVVVVASLAFTACSVEPTPSMPVANAELLASFPMLDGDFSTYPEATFPKKYDEDPQDMLYWQAPEPGAEYVTYYNGQVVEEAVYDTIQWGDCKKNCEGCCGSTSVGVAFTDDLYWVTTFSSSTGPMWYGPFQREN